MEKEGFQINQPNSNFASLEMLVQIYARQEALINLVINKLAEKGENEETILKDFNDRYIDSKKNIMNLLYGDYGNLDLKDFFPEGGKG